MSRTRRGEKGPGEEYWASRLHPHGEVPGRITKKATAKKERNMSKKLEEYACEECGEVLDPDEYMCPLCGTEL